MPRSQRRRSLGCRRASNGNARQPRMNTIRIDAEAEEEIAHAIDRYEAEREGLGAQFWDELKTAVQSLEAPDPECGAVIGLPLELGVRRKLLTRFPYAIVFVEGD